MQPRIYKSDITQYCTIPEALKSIIAKVEEIYVFDMDVDTHCCELTPSRDMLFCYTTFTPTDEYDHDKHGEACHEFTDECERYTEPGCYIHCKQADPNSKPLTGFPADATIDDVQEYERCNRTYC